MLNQTTKKHKTLNGTVVSSKMHKTVVVRVDRIKKHPKYERRYRVSKRYKAHDEKNEFHVGDVVRIEETRPLSRDKKWRVVAKIGESHTAPVVHEPSPTPSESETSQE